MSFFQNSSTESAKKADFGPILLGLAAVLCATNFNNLYHFRLRRQRAYHKKMFRQNQKIQPTLLDTKGYDVTRYFGKSDKKRLLIDILQFRHFFTTQ